MLSLRMAWIVMGLTGAVACAPADSTRGAEDPMSAMHAAAPGSDAAVAVNDNPNSATEHHAEAPVTTPPRVDPVSAERVAAAPRDITIPAGTTLRLQLGTPVSSKNSSVEDAVHATLRSPIVVNGQTVVPAGASVSGHVTEATRPGRVKGVGRVGMRFTTLRVGNTRYSIRTAAVTRQAGTTKKDDASKIGIGAGAGAITGAIAGGKKGAAIGTAVGAGGGTAVVLATRGDDVSIARGTVVTARLAQPVTIRVH